MARRVLILLLAMIAAEAETTDFDASEMFLAGSEAFQRGDYVAAADAFEAARAAGMSGPAVLYNAGVSHYRQGDYARAAHAFRELAHAFPAMRELADYNLGLSLNRQNRVGEARAAFRRALGSDDPALARLAAEMLERLGEDSEAALGPRGSGSWVRLVDVTLGYDDNVALIEEASLPAGRSSASPLLEAFGLLSARLGESASLRLDASAYLVRFSRADEFDQEGMRLAVGYLWQWRAWRLDAGPHYDHSLLAGRAFERRLGAWLRARHPLGEENTLSIRYVRDEVEELSPEFELVDGARDRITVDFERRGERGRLEVGYAHERNDRAGPSVSPVRHEVFAGYEHELNADWSMGVQGVLRASRYGRLAAPRDEDLSQLSVTAMRDFESGWQLLGRYRVADNDSNVSEYTYDRNRLTLSLNRLF